jgi:2-aminoadipate transaminase
MYAVAFARRAERLAPAMPAPVQDGTIGFDSGHAFPGVLPDLTREAEVALSRYRAETLQYAPRAGLPELRAWAAQYTDPGVTADEILVTNGAKHALELVCRLLIDEGDSVVVTAPTYFSAIPIVRSYGAAFIEVPQDDQGMNVGALAVLLGRLPRMPKFIYNVPDFHNPTGLTMPLDRRLALIGLAEQYGIVLVEDSPYREVRFEGDSVPSLKSLGGDRVIQLGTFSKLMAPGLRVGWAAAPAPFVARMAQLKTDAGSCPLTQRVILEFLTAGRLPAHITQVQKTYRANRDHMLAALAREMPEATYVRPKGGYYVWLTLPEGADGDAVAACAASNGVAIIAGSRFYTSPGPKNRVRLAFSHASPKEIDEGVRRVAEALHATRQ